MAIEDYDFGYEEFASLNKEAEANELDYLNVIFDLTGVHPDFIVSITRLLYPEFNAVKSRLAG